MVRKTRRAFMTRVGVPNPLTLTEIVNRTPKVHPVNWQLAGAGHMGPNGSWGMNFPNNLGMIENVVNSQGKTIPVIFVRGK